MGRFVHLHLHSEYSLLDGACRVRDIPKLAKAAGHDAVAITDHGVMYGVVDFFKACEAEGVKPIIGCEVYVARRSRFDKVHEQDSSSYHLVLLVENETGYRNLIRMVSLAFTEGFYSKPRVDMELLEQYHEGLIALSACLAGYIPRMIVSGEYEEAEKFALRMRDLFGKDRFYLEIQDHGIKEQQIVNAALAEMSRKTGIGLVATNDVHYPQRSDAETQAILMCIQTNNVITDGRPIGFETDEFYYKNTWEMEKLFSTYEGALENTGKIADMCDFRFSFGHTELPRYKPANGLTPAMYLAQLAEEGFSRRIQAGHIRFEAGREEKDYRERITYELSVIESMGYSEYYLIVWDFVHHAKTEGIPVGPGRGSGAGSLVAYLIGIIDIDPLRFGLLFERFLNPERVSMPDFDIDFCYDRRDEAIEYVRGKYGEDHTSQIITFGTMAARAVIRDVGRALGMSYAEVDEVAKLIPRTLGITLEDALKQENMRELYDGDEKIRRLVDVAAALEGMPRHASTHAAGVVITERPLSEYVPLAVNNGVVVTQFDMNTIAELGLLKFDFLALRYLTIIEQAEAQIRENQPDFDISAIPLDDKRTYDLISAGKTDGVFQLESGGMRQTLTQMKPTRIGDIIAAIALYRPGPMDSIPKYIENSRNPQKIRYITPLLAPILDETNGCIVYQEQVMQIFRVVAGYSLGRADIVRRAISKKKLSVLESERAAFLAGAAQHNVDEKSASALFDEIVGFANYAFNKSHAAAYALLSYRTAYLKAHYPREYISALMTSVLGASDKLAEYISECGRIGIRVLPPSVNDSARDFHVDGKNIRYGLLALKNLGRQFVDALISERKRNGPFVSFDDFMNRTDDIAINKRQLEMLIKSGALDGLGAKRSQMLTVYESVLDARASSGRQSLDGQLDLFAIAPAAREIPKITLPEIPEYSPKDLLRLEKDSSGLYFSGHLLDEYGKHLTRLRPDTIAAIKASFSTEETVEEGTESASAYSDKQQVILAGIITRRQNKATKNGEQMAFLTLEDRGGEIEVIVFPKVMQMYGPYLLPDAAIAVSGTISARDDEDAKILMRDMQPLIEDIKWSEESRKTPAQNTQQQADTAAEAAPQAASSPVKQETPAEKNPTRLFLKVDSMDSPLCKRAACFLEIFPGPFPVVFYDASCGKYLRAEHLSVSMTQFVYRELTEILGSGNVILK
ncbi:MAG: DNA polymerase III subunit alpha [Ruminococcaceae bacterium]|nr:DNA polymerase III subunit alpha [Oscillospiraceae bacterium]